MTSHHHTHRLGLSKFLDTVLPEDQRRKLEEQFPLPEDTAAYITPAFGPRQLWSELRKLSGSKLVGPELAAKFDPRVTGVLWLHLSRQLDARMALLAFCRALPIIFPTMRARLVVTRSSVALEVGTWNRRISTDGSDFAAATICKTAKMLVPDFAPTSVSFPSAPADNKAYEPIFGCPVETTSGYVIQICFPPAVLETRMAMASSDDFAEEINASIERARTFVPSAALEVQYDRALRQGGDITLEAVGQLLGRSTAQLSRTLYDMTTTHRELVDRARLRLTLVELGEDNATIESLTARLGMGHRSAFIRAFRRWTGTTPARFRDKYLLSTPYALAG